MNSRSVYISFNLFAILWVGGWGLLAFRYPRFFANWNARFGLRRMASPKSVNFIRKSGIVGMAMALLSAIGFVLTLIFGLKWYT